MKSTILALHGFTLNGTLMREAMREVTRALGPDVTLLCPDAPHPCSPETLDRAYFAWKMARPAPPHQTWWDATEDGREYRGWEQTRDFISRLIDQHGPVTLVGFSQGASVASTMAALFATEKRKGVHATVLIAGRLPRADSLRPLYENPIAIPSLHVWGLHDSVNGAHSLGLVNAFDPSTREVAVWDGPHMVPLDGNALDAIVRFVRTPR